MYRNRSREDSNSQPQYHPLTNCTTVTIYAGCEGHFFIQAGIVAMINKRNWSKLHSTVFLCDF